MSCGFVFVRCSHRNHLASYSRIFLKNDPLAGGGNHTIVYRFYARACKKVFHPFYVLSIFDEGLGEEQIDINSEQLLGKYTCFGLFYHLLSARFVIAVPLCTNCHKYATCYEGKCVCKAGYLGNGNVCEGIHDLYFCM